MCAAPLKPSPSGSLASSTTDGRHHAAEDHRHLPLLGQADRFAAARDGVDDHEEPRAHDDEIQAPAQHGGEDDGGRIDGHPGGEAALEQEEPRAEQTRLAVEAPAEELVGGVHTEPPVDRQEHGGHDDEGEGQPEVVLHESDAALESLPRDGKEGDRARLGGHHGQADRPPADGLAALEVRVEAPDMARAPGPVGGDADHGAEQHHPVGEVHEKIRLKHRKQDHHEHEPSQHEQVDAAPRAESGQSGRLGVGSLVGRRWSGHWPSETRFANSRYAPGTPSGSWRNHARLVYTK